MKGFTHTTITGNLTRDPEMRQTGNGKSVTNFSVAVNTRRSGEDYVSYFDCVAWEGLAETINEFKKKGDAIMVDGKLLQERWESDGGNRSKVVIVADDVVFVSGGEASGSQSQKASSGRRSAPQRRSQRAEAADEETFDEIPF